MKKIFISSALLATVAAFAQTGKVGINTSSPKATLDIKPSAANADAAATTNEGVLIPRLSKARVIGIGAANLVESTIVFVTDDVVAGDNGTFTGTGKGFYYYDAATSRWVKINTGAGGVGSQYTAGQGIAISTTNVISRTGLEEVTENGKTGWRLIGSDPANHFDIGTGAIDLSEYNNGVTTAIGDYAFSAGQYSTATGNNSVALGNGRASGEGSISFGRNAVASGVYSFASNYGNASGNGSVAMGAGEAYADASVAIGPGIASGEYSFSSNFGIASGRGSVAMGGGQASADASVAIGPGKASGEYAVALGVGEAKGNYSLAFGEDSISAGLESIALGKGSRTGAGAENAVAFSGGTANGVGSFSYGQNSIANGIISFAFGVGSVSNNYREVSFNQNFSTDTSFDQDGSEGSDFTKQLFSVGYEGQNSIVTLRNSYTGIGIVSDTTTPENSKPTEMLDVNGKIRVRGDGTDITVGGSCTNPGAISFYNDNFYGCKSTGWVLLNN